MSEQQLRKHVVKILVNRDAKPVENPAWPGFPDVNYIEGVIELKQLDRWPVRPETPIKLPHFTNQQRIFLERRWRKGGNAFLLLQVGRCFLLYEGCNVQRIGRMSTQGDLRDMALYVFDGLDDLKGNLEGWLDRKQISPAR